MSQVMELSKEVHGLLDRIKRLSNAQNTTTPNHDAYQYDSINRMYSTLDEIDFTSEDLIPLDNFDMSNRETWLFVPETAEVSSSGIDEIPSNSLNTSKESDKYNRKLDTRTFTRPKKRILRPRLNEMSDTDPNNEKSPSKITDLESIKIPENPFQISTKNDLGISTGPLHFKLSDPVMNHSFDKILLSSSDRYDSFQNMSPPSLMNSLCSSTFTTLIDSSGPHVPNDVDAAKVSVLASSIIEMRDSFEEILAPPNNDRMESSCTNSIISTDKINKLLSSDTSDLNLTFTPTARTQNSINRTYDKKECQNEWDCETNEVKTINGRNDLCFDMKNPDRNSTFSKNNNKNINLTYQTIMKPKSKLTSMYSTLNKTNSYDKLNSTFTASIRTNTFTKKPRNIINLPESLKKSCPDINRTYQPLSYNHNLIRTSQKFSDSQPNLTKDVQQTILNQSFDLMKANIYEGYKTARSGSTDSLDDKSSTISNSSKESGSKVLNIGDLDNLARLQEQSLQQIMSTPKPKGNLSKFWDSEQISPIHKQEEYLSEDSDVSDVCLTARSRISQRSNSPLSSTKFQSRVTHKGDINKLLQPQPRKDSSSDIRTVPTMIVKPMEVDKTFKVDEKQTMQPPEMVRPRIRASGLPRPTSMTSTGIPRPASRIPAPRFTRTQMMRPTFRPAKTEWNDGCY